MIHSPTALPRHPRQSREKALSGAISAALSALLFANPLAALAQTPTPAADATEDELGAVVVTGSRIRSVDAETAQPVLTITREDLAATGVPTIGDYLQDIAAGGATLNTQRNNAGTGETRVNLRSLGSARTLVLVNGRRWIGSAGSLDGGVNLNSVPLSAVERIEVLKDGASAVYGSDAIAGVVNIILRSDFDGTELEVTTGQTSEGDGETSSAGLTMGARSDRGSVFINASYVEQKIIGAGDREISRVPAFGFNPQDAAAGASPTSPFGQFDAAGRGRVTLIPGRPGTAPSDFKPFNDRVDGYNFAPENFLQTPFSRYSIFGSGRYEVSDEITAVSEVLYSFESNETLLASTPLAFQSNGGAGAGAAFGISRDSVFNPFGSDITRVRRRLVETGGRSTARDVTTFRALFGLSGAFDLSEKYYTWDVGYVFTRSDSVNNVNGAVNLAAVRAAVGPSFRDAAGVAFCGTPNAVIAGCLPLNLTQGPGSVTQAMLNNISITAHDLFQTRQEYLYANLTGDLLELPAGILGMAVGVETRKESGFDSPDAFAAQGLLGGLNARLPTNGGYDVDEAYAEFRVPILADQPFAKGLELSLAGRTSDYSTFGDTTNLKAGIRYQPNDEVVVRASFAEGFRAPDISNLFGGQADGFPNINDPCSRLTAQDPETQRRCVATGVPANGSYIFSGPQQRVTGGSNANLQPETSTSQSIGLVYSPAYIEGLNTTLDFWRVNVENSIVGGLGAQFILDQCYVQTVQNPALCQQITRAASGEIISFFDTATNIGTTDVRGFDLGLNYALPELDFGRFSLAWDTTYLSDYVQEVPGAGPPDNLVGEADTANFVVTWRVRSKLDLRWNSGNWNARLGARFFSSVDDTCTSVEAGIVGLACSDGARTDGDGNAAPEHRIGAVTYFDGQVGYELPWQASIAIGGNNLFRKDPPLAPAAFGNSFDPSYDIPGSFYYLRYTQKF